MQRAEQNLVKLPLTADAQSSFVDLLSTSIVHRLEKMVPANGNVMFRNVREAVLESLTVIQSTPNRSSLPVASLTVQEIIGQGLIEMSQATLYRAAEDGRFYYITPAGKSSGKVFPAWQFVAPVPELLVEFKTLLDGHPKSVIHAFWVTAEDALNELSPAEMLAGKPFETRTDLHPSQLRLLSLPTPARVRKIAALLKSSSWSMDEAAES